MSGMQFKYQSTRMTMAPIPYFLFIIVVDYTLREQRLIDNLFEIEESTEET